MDIVALHITKLPFYLMLEVKFACSLDLEDLDQELADQNFTSDTLVDVNTEEHSLDAESITSPQEGQTVLSPNERVPSLPPDTLEVPAEGTELTVDVCGLLFM